MLHVSARCGAVALALAAMHAAAFTLLHPHIGESVGTLAAIPALLVAWRAGARTGVAYTLLLTVAVNPALFHVIAGALPVAQVATDIVVGVVVVGLVGYLRDVRIRLGRGLTREQLRSLVDNHPSVVFETDAEGNWTFLNPAWAEITGFDVAASLGQPFHQFVHPDDRAVNLELFAPLIERRKSFCRHEIRYLSADGGYRWIEVHARLLMDAAGEARGTAGTLTDITRRRGVEEQLQATNRKYEYVLSLSPAVLYAVRLDGGTLDWRFISDNIQEQSGYTAAELMANPDFWRSLVHPEDRQAVYDGMPMLREGGRYSREYRVRRADGEYCWIRDTGIAIEDEAGEIVEVVGSWIDATAARKQEEQTRRLASVEAARAEAEAGNERLQSMLEGISDGFFSLDDAGRFTYVNATAERILNEPRERLLGRPVREVLPDATAEGIASRSSDVSHARHLHVFEHHDEPTGRWYTVRVHPTPGGHSVLFHDVTERHAAEAEARRREALHTALSTVTTRFAASAEADIDEALRSLGEALGVDRAYVFRLREGGAVADNTQEWCAPGTEAFMNRTQGLRVDQYPWWFGEMQADRPIVLETVEGVPASERAMWAVIEAQGIQAMVAAPIRSDASELLGFIGFDDTKGPRRWSDEDVQILRVASKLIATQLARREAEHALRRSEQDYRGLFEHAHDAILILDPESEIVLDVNPRGCQMYGLPRERFVGTSLRDMSVDPERGEQQIQHALLGDGTHFFDTVQRRADGTEIVLEVTAAVIDYQGRRAILSINRDITARRVLETQLRQAQKMEAIGQLAGGVAHDFNNMLTAIGGYTELLRMDATEELDRESLEEIARATDRAASLTHQLLAFSRQQVLQPSVLSLNRIITELSGMLGRLIGESIELTTVLDGRLGSVRADAGQLQQVLLNLTVNARDAMPDGGKITIETRNIELSEPYSDSHPDVAPGPYVLMSVSDTGTGMDAATRDRIFDPFFTTKEVGSGTGLGLSTVYGIVRQSGGHIFVYSEPGSGSSFKIYLPRVAAADEEDGDADPGHAPLPRGSGTILLVEDEAAVRGLAAAALSRAGYHVIEAASAAEAARLCDGGLDRPDLLITDVIMPGPSGRVLAEQLEKRWPGMQVIYMSGYTDDAIVRHGVLQPGVHFIQKPFGPTGLVRFVHGVIG